jgi:hypothetical protein
MDLLKDDTMVEILGCVHKTMLPYYAFYASSKGLMNFDGFIKFCTDFAIFPDILSKSRIMRFFSTLSSFYQSTNYSGDNSSKSSISIMSTSS